MQVQKSADIPKTVSSFSERTQEECEGQAVTHQFQKIGTAPALIQEKVGSFGRGDPFGRKPVSDLPGSDDSANIDKLWARLLLALH